MSRQDPSSFPSAEELWTAQFQEVCERIGPCFSRSETRNRARAYLQGLLSPIERKNGWQLAEEAGESTPYAMQYWLDRAVWAAQELGDVVREYIKEAIGDANGMLVIDETGFLKKGSKSVGVQREYSGTAGRIENCQIGVFLTYTTPAGHSLLDRELYLPKSWTNDPERSREADVPTEVRLATKPELAARMLWRTLDAGVKASFVLGASVYGSHRRLRAGLEARSQAYALAVACKERVEVQGKRQRVDQVARALPTGDWQRLSAGDGSKGPRLFDWACREIAGPEKEGWKRCLVIRRSLTAGAKAAELAYFLVFAPHTPTLSEIVTAIGSRWTVEQCFEEAKGEVGLDEYEVRSFHGWYRHITLSMLAHAFLTVLRAQSQGEWLPSWQSVETNRPGESLVPLSVRGSPDSGSWDQTFARTEKKTVETLPVPDAFPDALGLQTPAGAGLPILVPLSLAEVRRLLHALLLSHPLPFLHRLAWSFFRRTHQAIARRFHYKRRLAALL